MSKRPKIHLTIESAGGPLSTLPGAVRRKLRSTRLKAGAAVSEPEGSPKPQSVVRVKGKREQ